MRRAARRVVREVSISRVVIIHGYLATPADHWFPWLATTLDASGIGAEVVALPDSDAPELPRWVAAAADAIGTPDETTAIVTHSLGGVTALNALDRIQGAWRLGALIAVAGFTDALPALPQLDAFTRQRPDVARTASRTSRRVVVHSDDDTFVPPAHTIALGAALDAETVTVTGAGHFLAADGIASLPQVAERILR